jgi:hypothetical protein
MRDSKDGTYDKKLLPRVDFPQWTCHGEETLDIMSIVGVIMDFIDNTLFAIVVLLKV